MSNSRNKKLAFAALALAVTLATLLSSSIVNTRAADHFDAPLVSNDQGADIADAYFFLDPNDNTRAIVAMTVQGFIVPGEATNAGGFDHNIRYRFELENTGDARPDRFLDVTFTPRTGSDDTADGDHRVAFGRVVYRADHRPVARYRAARARQYDQRGFRRDLLCRCG